MRKLACILMALIMLMAFAACEAQTETVKPKTVSTDGTESAAVIFSVTVIHADGEESTNNLSSTCEYLMEALLERKLVTEDMLTVDGEKADPAENAYWNLYIDGVYATESWDKIVLEDGVDYMFEYVLEMDYEGEPEEEIVDGPGEETTEAVSDGAYEDTVEESLGE